MAVTTNTPSSSSSSSSSSPPITCWSRKLITGLMELDQLGREFRFVNKTFMAGLGVLSSTFEIVGIYKDLHVGFSREARALSFEAMAKGTMAKCGGDGNLGFGWHGSCRDHMKDTLVHGFGERDMKREFGVGVYLSPINSPLLSVMDCEVDKYGLQHILLCKVIKGRTEEIYRGSQQFHPSDLQFDSGIDDRENPRRCIVWATHINTHILPLYVVTFKVPPQFHEFWSREKWRTKSMDFNGDENFEQWRSSLEKKMSKLSCMESSGPSMEAFRKMTSPMRKPTSPWVSFSLLITLLAQFLPASSMGLIKQNHANYKAHQISRECLVRRVRQIVGDELLAATIKSFGRKHQISKL